MQSKSFQKVQFLFFLLSLAGFLIAVEPARADTRQITISWNYDSSITGIGGFRLYLQGASACETSDPSARQLTCSVNLVSGDNSFTLTAFDTSNNESSPSAPYILSYSSNTIPTTQNIVINLAEDSSASGTMPGTDPDNDPLTFSIVNQPVHGLLSLLDSAVGTYSYTPAANYNGSDSFTFKVNDGQADSAVATAAITISPVNDPPEANNDTATVNEDQSITVDVLANDNDVDNDPLQVLSVSTPAHGSARVVNNKVFYTPAANYSGLETFSYSVSDGSVNATATVAITVRPVNDAPVAENAVATVDEDQVLSGQVVASDVENDPLTFALVSQASHGTVSIVDPVAGSYTYTPTSNYSGVDSFTFKANDGNLDSAPGTVTITINAVNDPPVANAGPDQNVKMRADVTLDGSLSSDPDDGIKSVAWQQISGPQVILSDPASLKPTFVAPDVTSQGGVLVFAITVTDNGGLQAQATTTVNVSWMLPAPSIGLLKLN